MFGLKNGSFNWLLGKINIWDWIHTPNLKKKLGEVRLALFDFIMYLKKSV